MESVKLEVQIVEMDYLGILTLIHAEIVTQYVLSVMVKVLQNVLDANMLTPIFIMRVPPLLALKFVHQVQRKVIVVQKEHVLIVLVVKHVNKLIKTIA